jgi:hypothetical protein
VKTTRRHYVQALLDNLLAKYRSDTRRFRAYLPEAAQILDALEPQKRTARGSSGLTEHERARRIYALERNLGKLQEQTLRRDDAIAALEDYAALLDDDSVPEGFDFDKRIGVLKAAIGKAPGSFKTQATLQVKQDFDLAIVNTVSLVRGVHLNLTWDKRLVSVAVVPRLYRERKRLMAFVGAVPDSASDVARRHDAYLGEIDPHASA